MTSCVKFNIKLISKPSLKKKMMFYFKKYIYNLKIMVVINRCK